MSTRRTSVGARASGRSSALGSEQATRAASSTGNATRAGAGTPAASPSGAPLPGTTGAQSPQNIPALSEAAKEQAERDRTGKTRPGYVRRPLPNGGSFNGVWYPSGANVEIPQNFADHLDAAAKNPDASTEIGRKTKFTGGKEDDHAEQAKAIKTLADGVPAAQKKHLQGDQFSKTGARPKGAKAGKK